MALQSSGRISILDIVGEFGGSSPHGLGEYYRGGVYVPSSVVNATSSFMYSTAFSIRSYWQYRYVSGFTDSFKVVLYWDGSYLGQPLVEPEPLGVVGSDGFTYVRGAVKTDMQETYKREVARGEVISNTGIPSSGRIDFADFYGGRKT